MKENCTPTQRLQIQQSAIQHRYTLVRTSALGHPRNCCLCRKLFILGENSNALILHSHFILKESSCVFEGTQQSINYRNVCAVLNKNSLQTVCDSIIMPYKQRSDNAIFNDIVIYAQLVQSLLWGSPQESCLCLCAMQLKNLGVEML